MAVVIPCYQEALTIGKVVADFAGNSLTQGFTFTTTIALTAQVKLPPKAGAIVRREKRQGKGFVVAAMFDQIEEDILVMVDGDDTYDAAFVHKLIEPILRGDADMTAATRLTEHEEKSFRPLHTAGNRLVSVLINWMFSSQISDIFSGYRGFTRAAVRQIPITARGFDVETELTLQALYRGLVIKEMPSAYRARPEGSFSKLNTFSDGFRVLLRLFLIFKSYKPLTFFGGGSLLLFGLGLLAGARPVYEYFADHYVYAVPSAVLAAALMLLSFFSLGLGLILNSVNLRLLELEKLVTKESARHGE